MIFEYEKEFLRFMSLAVPGVNSAVYAEKEEMLESFNKVKTYPAFFYSRSSEDWTLAKSVSVKDGPVVDRFFPILINYKGSILVEKQQTALNLIKSLRFYWTDNPYLSVPFTCKTDKIKVGLRLLYIKLEESRNNSNDRGPLRYVEMAWQSQLFITESSEQPIYTGLRLTVNNKIVIIK